MPRQAFRSDTKSAGPTVRRTVTREARSGMPAQSAICSMTASASASTAASPLPFRPPLPMVGSAGMGTRTKTFSWSSGATSESTPLGLQTYSDGAVGTCGSAPKMESNPAFQSSANSSVWCSSWGRSPRTPRYMRSAEGPGTFRSQYDCGYDCWAGSSSTVSLKCRSTVETTRSASRVCECLPTLYSTPVAAPCSTTMRVARASVMIVTPSARARSAMVSMTRANPPIGYCTPSARSRWLISWYMLGAM